MAMMMGLSTLAAGARVPVCCLVGDGGRRRARALRLLDGLQVVASPRHATVLVVVGELPRSLHQAAALMHDQLPIPRGVVVWGGGDDPGPFPHAVRIDDDGDVGSAIVALHRGLLLGWRRSSASCRHDLDEHDHERPTASKGPDPRDGLRLDRMVLTIGPFLPWLPPGLQLDLGLQGDVIASLDAHVPALRHEDLPEPFQRARTQVVPLAQLELARARHHLGATVDLLLALGLEPLAERTLRLAATLEPGDAERVRRLDRVLRRSGALWLATHGVGRLPPERLAHAGPVARAAGRHEDARLQDPAYVRLGFRPHVRSGGDAQARWQQRLVEAADALELAARAGRTRRAPGPPLEGPRGPVDERSAVRGVELLRELAPGTAWDAFVTTLVSLDLDPTVPPEHVGLEHELLLGASPAWMS